MGQGLMFSFMMLAAFSLTININAAHTNLPLGSLTHTAKRGIPSLLVPCVASRYVTAPRKVVVS
jgi:hypothetical protein